MNFIPKFLRRKNDLLITRRLNQPIQDGFWVVNSTNISYDNYAMDSQANIKLIEKFNGLAEISAPIRKYSENSKQVIPDLFVKQASGKLKLVNEKHWAYKPILKFWQEQIDKALIYDLLLGNLYITANSYGTIETGMQALPQEFILLPPQNTKIKVEKNIDFRSPIIVSYDVLFPEKQQKYSFDPKSTLHVKTNNPLFINEAYLYGISSLVSCTKNIKAIESGYSTRVALYEKGARVIITGKTQGEFAAANLQTNEDIKQVAKRFNNEYGISEGKFQIMATDIPLDVTVISRDVKQLQLNEMNQSDLEKICSVLDVDPLVVASTIGTTFSNKEEANKNFYTGSFKRKIDGLTGRLTEFINRWDSNVVIKANYTQIPEIVDAQKRGNDELLNLTKMGLLTRNQYYEETGWPTIAEDLFNEFCVFSGNDWIPINRTEDGQGTNEPDTQP